MSNNLLLSPEELNTIWDKQIEEGETIAQAYTRIAKAQHDKILVELQKLDRKYSCSLDYSDAMKSLIAGMEQEAK